MTLSPSPDLLGSADDLFSEARRSLESLGFPKRLDALRHAGVNIRRSVLGGSHSVAVYPPIDSLTPIEPDQILNTIDCGPDASLYIHIAFCETRCTFCHYTVQNYAGPGHSAHADEGVRRYIEALRTELKSWGERLARSDTSLSSIYIGGGTPLVLDADTLGALLADLRKWFSILPTAEICIEGSPLTITAPDGQEKLRLVKSQGVTRLSFGAQSFDDTVLKYAARGYSCEVATQASEIVASVFGNWNIDLIQGLYKGSTSEAWTNLRAVARLRPAHLTWYHARFSDRPQGAWYHSASKRAGFEDEADLLLGRMLIWRGMARLGYRRIDGNRFVRQRHYVDHFKSIRTSVSRNLLGAGASAYSHIADRSGKPNRWGQSFRNIAEIPAYLARVEAGEHPIATARQIDDGERLAWSYATELRGKRIEDAEACALRKRSPECSAYYDALADQMERAEVLESFKDAGGHNGLRLTELGRLFEDEVLALFFSPTVKEVLSARARSAANQRPLVA